MCRICWESRGAPTSSDQDVLKAASTIEKMLIDTSSALGRASIRVLDIKIPGAYATRVVFGDWNVNNYALGGAYLEAKQLRDNYMEPSAELALDALSAMRKLSEQERNAAMGLAYRFYDTEPQP